MYSLQLMCDNDNKILLAMDTPYPPHFGEERMKKIVQFENKVFCSRSCLYHWLQKEVQDV